VIFESHHEALLDRIPRAFEASVDDTIADAERVAPKVTGRFAASIIHGPIERTSTGVRTTFGSTLSSARVKERGGFVPPYGNLRAPRVRVRAQPTVTVAGPRWVHYMGQRLRSGLGGLFG
jgi:hypothetical protein